MRKRATVSIRNKRMDIQPRTSKTVEAFQEIKQQDSNSKNHKDKIKHLQFHRRSPSYLCIGQQKKWYSVDPSIALQKRGFTDTPVRL